MSKELWINAGITALVLMGTLVVYDKYVSPKINL